MQWSRDTSATPTFVGRWDELKWLSRFLLEDSRNEGVVAVVGPVGAGKTALVSRFAEQHRADFPGGVRFLFGRDIANVGASGALPVPGDGQGLLVIDEADSAPAAELSGIVEFLRGEPRVNVILIAQRQIRIAKLPQLSVGAMNVAEVTELAREFALSPAELSAVIQLSEGAPLVAHLLAGYAGKGHLGGVIEQLGDELLAALAREPELLYSVSYRKFEELVAYLYEREGYEVELTPVSNDGGVDIYAVQRTSFGAFLTVVDCKRYRKDRPVEVGLIRQLLGTVHAKDASVGVLATTSYFTKGAEDFQKERRYRLGLQDFLSIHQLLLQQD